MSGGVIKRHATILGIAAIVVWSLMVGLVRTVTSTFGPVLGTALIYTVGACLLFIVHRPARLRSIPPRYLLVGGALFVAYEVLFALAIGFSVTEVQTIEVSMLNYLWPTFTVLFWSIGEKRRGGGSLLWVVPGAVVATAGVVLTVGGQELFASGALFEGVAAHPLPYAFAFTAAVLWGLYNMAAPAYSDGANAVAFFFAGIAATLWVVYLVQGMPASPEPVSLLGALPLLAAAVAVAMGYALWGYGIVYGSMQKLSVASYAAPVLSSISSAVILAMFPSPVFWAEAVLVAVGSVLSWLGSQRLVRG